MILLLLGGCVRGEAAPVPTAMYVYVSLLRT